MEKLTLIVTQNVLGTDARPQADEDILFERGQEVEVWGYTRNSKRVLVAPVERVHQAYWISKSSLITPDEWHRQRAEFLKDLGVSAGPLSQNWLGF